MGVASSAVRDNVEFVLETLRLKDYFSEVTTADDSAHPKPHPAIYLLTAEKLGVPPEDCVAFEDSFSGICSAQAAGMIVVAAYFIC